MKNAVIAASVFLLPITATAQIYSVKQSQTLPKAEDSEVEQMKRVASRYRSAHKSESAIIWYTRAAEEEDEDSIYVLGFMAFVGEGQEKNYTESMRWFRKGAALGQARSMEGLSILYSEGAGVPVDHKEAVRWLRLAAERGSSIAMLNLARAYKYGKGVEQSDDLAAQWQAKASASGGPLIIMRP
jgi:TPR repeat protein